MTTRNRAIIAMLIAILSVGVITAGISVTAMVDVRPLMPNPQATPTPTPTPDAVLDEAKRQTSLDQERQKQAEARKAEADAKNALLKEQVQPLGATTVTVPSGNVTTDQAGFVEVQMLAQEAANQISLTLENSLCGKKFLVTPNRPGEANGQPSPTPTLLTTLVIYNNSDLVALSLYRPMMDQLGKFESDFNTRDCEANLLLAATDPAPPATPLPRPISCPSPHGEVGPLDAAFAIPSAATSVISSVAQLVNLFRTDTSFQNKTVTISDDMVVSYVVEHFNADSNCSSKPAIFYPALYPPQLFRTAKSDLLEELARVSALRTAAATNAKNVDDRVTLINTISGNIDKLTSEQKSQADKVKQALQDPECKTDICKQITKDIKGQLDKLKQALKDPKCKTDKCKQLVKDIGDLQTQIDTDTTTINKQTGGDPKGFQKNYKDWLAQLNRIRPLIQSLIDSADKITASLNTPDSSNKTALASLLASERLKTILEQPTSFTLRASMTANGTTKIKKNIFVDAKVRHSAGADLVYQLFDLNGSVVLGGVMHCYFDYQSAQRIRSAVGGSPISCVSSAEPPKSGKP